MRWKHWSCERGGLILFSTNIKVWFTSAFCASVFYTSVPRGFSLQVASTVGVAGAKTVTQICQSRNVMWINHCTSVRSNLSNSYTKERRANSLIYRTLDYCTMPLTLFPVTNMKAQQSNAVWQWCGCHTFFIPRLCVQYFLLVIVMRMVNEELFSFFSKKNAAPTWSQQKHIWLLNVDISDLNAAQLKWTTEISNLTAFFHLKLHFLSLKTFVKFPWHCQIVLWFCWRKRTAGNRRS